MSGFLQSENVTAWQAQNVTPLITWEPNNVNYTDVIAGNWDTYLTTSALAIKQFNGTIFLRPFHEFNGAWESYGLANQGASPTADANFKLAWQHMVTIFRNNNVTNVRWVWCYANHGSPNEVGNYWNDAINAYPGDAYVDWVAYDAFNRGSLSQGVPWLTFDQLTAAAYTKAVKISPARPVMVAELGANDYGDGGALKATFFSTMFNEVPATYPHLRAIGYFDFSNSFYSYGIQSSIPAYNAWVNGLRTINTSGILNYRGYGAPLNNLTAWNQ